VYLGADRAIVVRMLRLTIWMMVVACSSSYVPQSRGRVAVTIQGGTFEYVRDGQHYPHGFFGSGLEDAVAGNPRAAQSAHEYHDRVLDGTIAAVVGSLCMPAALTYVLVEAANEPTSRQTTEVGALVALGCTALLIGGASYAASAEPYRWDAINQFNDAATLAPGINLGSAPAPKASLGMR
jgi:hypothetical protein